MFDKICHHKSVPSLHNPCYLFYFLLFLLLCLLCLGGCQESPLTHNSLILPPWPSFSFFVILYYTLSLLFVPSQIPGHLPISVSFLCCALLGVGKQNMINPHPICFFFMIAFLRVHSCMWHSRTKNTVHSTLYNAHFQDQF